MTTAVVGRALRRRRLRFHNFDEVLAEAQRLVAGETVCLGQWTLGQTLKHLGIAMVLSCDGKPFAVAWHLRLVGRLFFKPVMLYWQFPAGFKLPGRAAAILVPSAETSPQEGLEYLKRGMARLAADPTRVPHPLIGPLSAAQWNLLHLRHAELHLSFILPIT